MATMINPSTGKTITAEDIKNAPVEKESTWRKIGNWWNDITGASAAMEHESKEAYLQREFEREMSNTAIQRQVDDANAAGINPAMMYANSSSSGASTPSGAFGRGHTASGNIGNSFSSLLNSAANLARSFNFDKNHTNDVSFKDLKYVANTLSKFANGE